MSVDHGTLEPSVKNVLNGERNAFSFVLRAIVALGCSACGHNNVEIPLVQHHMLFEHEEGSLMLLVNSPIGQTGPSSQCDSAIGRSLVSMIDGSKRTIDLAAYGLRNQPEILESLQNAMARGVVVRTVVDKDVRGESYYSDTPRLMAISPQTRSDYEVDLETSQMPKQNFPGPFWPAPAGFEGPPQCVGYSIAGNKAVIAVHASREPLEFQGDIMHNKFAVIDHNLVWTGSCNLSDSGTGGYNANLAVAISSVQVAEWYTEEFNRMFEQGLFHRRKNTKSDPPNRLLPISDQESIQVAFSPQDRVYLNLIRPILRSAESRIDVAMFFLTHKHITADLINAHLRGVQVRVILDATAATNGYTKHEILRATGVPVKIENWGGKMHMKCACVDGKILIAGSMNWTSAGEQSNDENTVIIRSKSNGAFFTKHFDAMWNSIPKKWLQGRPDPESRDSLASVTDGIDNDFDNLVDGDDSGCSGNPPPLLPLPPHKIVPLKDGFDLIKGNISQDGKKIYHLPTDKYYRQTRIDTSKGERWFPSTWEAKEAGWRHARQ